MHVVLVDPSRTVLKIVTELLETRHHQVRSFTDSLAAFEYIKSDETIEAVITSAEQSSMPGIELCRKVRQLASDGRPIYVILMSSNADSKRLIEALENGADDFISKPPVFEELYARLRAAERVGAMQRELLRLAETDPLTGLYNRRAFFGHAADICARAETGGSLSAILFDIDKFKRVNDVYGHDVGDQVLCGISREAVTAKEFVIGRLGGEEFAILYDSGCQSDAHAFAEELRRRIENLEFQSARDAIAVTCSFGVSEWVRGDSIDSLLKRADIALYQAKSDGRNRIVVYDPALQLKSARESSPIRSQNRSVAAV